MAAGPSTTKRPLRPWLANLALVMASLFVGLILIELALRLLGWSYPVFVRPDASLGWSFRPGVEGWSTHEDTAYVRINRSGFRGGDWTERPAAGTWRIAVLGDSYTDSTNLSAERSLTGRIETHLSACPVLAGRRVEILNFGVSGYGTAQQYLQLQQRVASFHPDMVLLAFYTGNDVADNSRPLSVSTNIMKPFFVVRPSGELEYDGSFRDSAAFRQVVKRDWLPQVINTSYLLQVLKQAYLGKAIVPSPIKSHVFKSTGAAPSAWPQYKLMFGPPRDDNWRAAWSVTEKLLVRMRDWSQERKIEFRMAIIPEPLEALPGDAMRRVVVQKFELADIDYPVTGVVDIASRNGIPHLSLLEPLRTFGDREQQFTYGFYADRPGVGHLNAVGNEISGRAIAAWLCPAAANPARPN